jgi:hypothetical protein
VIHNCILGVLNAPGKVIRVGLKDGDFNQISPTLCPSNARLVGLFMNPSHRAINLSHKRQKSTEAQYGGYGIN